MDNASLDETAVQAKAILENPLFDSIIEELKQDMIKDWLGSQVYDQEGREKLFQYVRNLDVISAKLKKKIFDATFKDKQAQQTAKQDEFDRV